MPSGQSSALTRAHMPALPMQGYDQTYIPLIVIMSVMCVGICCAGCGMLNYEAFRTQHARPLRYNEDVMRI